MAVKKVGDRRRPVPGGARLTSWPAYFFALVATSATFGLRLAMEDPLDGYPTLVIFTLPIMLSAYLGGLRAGLLATAIACLGASYYLLPPLHSFAVASSGERWQQFFVALAGVSISGLSESLHRARRRAEAATSDQQRAESARRSSEERLRAYVEQAADCLFVHDDSGRLLDVNPQACTTLGYRREELLAMNLADVETTFDLPSARQAWSHMVPGRPLIIRGVQRRKDGSTFPVEVRVGCFDSEGQRTYFGMTRDITERDRQEAATEQMLRRLSEAQRIGQIGDWEFDCATEAITWSSQTFTIFGRDPSLGPPCTYAETAALYEPASAALMGERVAALIASGEPQEYELVARRPDGQQVSVQARAVARKGVDGQVVGIYGTVQDVTERRQAERLVRESEERLGFAMDAAAIGDWDMNLRSNVARRSLRHDQCFGYTELLPAWGYDTFLAHIDPADRQRVDVAYQTAAAGRGDYDQEFRAPWPDGSTHWLWTKGRFYFDESGQPYRVAGIVTDITERRQAEEAAYRLAAIVASSEDAIVGEDLNGVVMSWNHGAESVYGYPAREMVGTSIQRLIPPDRLGEEVHLLESVKRGGASRHFETVRRKKDGKLIDIAVTASPIKDGAGQVVGVSKIARDITAQKAAADELKRSEARLAEAQRIARIGNWNLDAATGALSWSAEIYVIFGLDRAAFGASYEAFLAAVHPDDRARVDQSSRATLAGGPRHDMEHRIVRPDGTERIVHELAVATYDADGRPVQLAGTVQDITERVQTQTRLRESEATFAAAFRASPMAMVITTLESRFVEVNQAYCDLVGLSREDSLGHTIMELGLLSENARQEVVSAMETAGGTFNRLELELSHRDGTPRHVIAGVTEITLAGVRHRLSTAVDVTEQRRAERSLRESELRYRRLFETARDGIVILDASSGRVMDVNPHLLTLLGVPRDRFLGRAVWELAFFKEVVGDAGTFGQICEQEYVRVPHLPLETGSGEQVEVEFISNVYEVDARKVIQCSIRDVTARRQAELALQQLNSTLEERVARRTAELEAANRELAAHADTVSRDLRVAEAADRIKSTFLATMSHELRTPLNSIIGFTGLVLLGKAGPLNAEQKKQLGMVRESGRHLLALVNDVLDLSKIEAGQIGVRTEPFDLRASIERVLVMIRPLAEKKNLLLAAEVSPALGEMVSDQRRVEQILLNLLSNAVKFTERGRVLLAADVVTDFQPSPADAPRPAVRLRVVDTGIGIRPENLSILFQPFQQVDSGLARQLEGTGLGLAISRRLATLLGGEIAVASTWSKGSEFTVLLPLRNRSEP